MENCAITILKKKYDIKIHVTTWFLKVLIFIFIVIEEAGRSTNSPSSLKFQIYVLLKTIISKEKKSNILDYNF